MAYYYLEEFEQSGENKNIFFLQLLNLEREDLLGWEQKVRYATNLKYIKAFIENKHMNQMFKATKGKIIVLQSVWEKTHDIYKAARSTKPFGRYVSHQLVRDYIMSHKSVRILGKNGKKRNSNKSQFLQFRRSLLGRGPIPLSEKTAEKIFKEHQKQIRVRGSDHIYLYANIDYILHESGGIFNEEEEYTEERVQDFGSYHIPIDDIYNDSYEWYKSVDSMVNELGAFFTHESVEIISMDLYLVVRKFTGRR